MAKMSWISWIFETISGPGPKSGTMDNIHELEHITCGYIHVLEVYIYVYAWGVRLGCYIVLPNTALGVLSIRKSIVLVL